MVSGYPIPYTNLIIIVHTFIVLLNPDPNLIWWINSSRSSVLLWSFIGHGVVTFQNACIGHGQIDTNRPTWRSVFCILVQETISASALRIWFLPSWIWVHYAFTRIWTPNIWSNQYFFVCNMRFHLNFDKNFAKMCQNVETNNKRYCSMVQPCSDHCMVLGCAAIKPSALVSLLMLGRCGAGRRVLVPRLLATQCFVTPYFMHDVSIFSLIYHT